MQNSSDPSKEQNTSTAPVNLFSTSAQGPQDNSILGMSFKNTSSPTILDNNNCNFTKSSGIIGSIQDNSLNLYNLSFKEIIEKQTAILDDNIKEFEKSAQHVFEQDMKLIAAKTNYISIQNKIKTNTIKMDELMEALDYFAAELDKFDTKEDNYSENAKIIKEFELLCDKFYDKVENFHDENNGIMDLINENYELVEKLDSLLDDLEMKTQLIK